ncbi:hypothetical protein CBER1_09966 [Cercospora berteroae]|uniref:Uncharacterized protein n=1 Tax=Cercospora berteroae TaxID=357750 RepID=A0A2S6C5W8_9PEZI|nr:hypothetical protein CBER1_09966 [Cercospora berteroae]
MPQTTRRAKEHFRQVRTALHVQGKRVSERFHADVHIYIVRHGRWYSYTALESQNHDQVEENKQCGVLIKPPAEPQPSPLHPPLLLQSMNTAKAMTDRRPAPRSGGRDDATSWWTCSIGETEGPSMSGVNFAAGTVIMREDMATTSM